MKFRARRSVGRTGGVMDSVFQQRQNGNMRRGRDLLKNTVQEIIRQYSVIMLGIWQTREIMFNQLEGNCPMLLAYMMFMATCGSGYGIGGGSIATGQKLIHEGQRRKPGGFYEEVPTEVHSSFYVLLHGTVMRRRPIIK